MLQLLTVLAAAALPADPSAHSTSLGAADFAAREQAEDRLAVVLCVRPSASRTLCAALAASSCPEVRHRAASAHRRASAASRARAAAEVGGRYGLLPFLDSFWYDAEAGKYLQICDLPPWHAAAARIAAGYLEAAKPAPGAYPPGDGYSRYREGTRLLLVDLRLAGVPWAELDAFVTALRARDFAYCSRNPGALYAAPPVAGR